MAYYCNECATWQESSDAKMSYHNGKLVVFRWCSYDRQYRAADQNIYRCTGFVYLRRAIITKICEILGIDNKDLFKSFDSVKEEYLIPTEIGKLVDYNTIGKEITLKLDSHLQKEMIAKNMLDGYIIPAEAYAKLGKYEEAVSIYERMVKVLAVIFNVTKLQIEEKNFYNNLIKVH